MLDTPRITFYLSEALYAEVQTLAQRYDESVSQLCRDALTVLLSDLARYHDLRNTRLAQQHGRPLTPPTPEQAARSQQLIAEAMRTDYTALFLSAPP